MTDTSIDNLIAQYKEDDSDKSYYTIEQEQPTENATVDPIASIALENFGIKSLYPWQKMVIANILDASKYEDAPSKQIVLLPTGAGKSLCFMIPSLLLKGSTLILYPLLALMSDQERRMRESGLDPVVLKGSQTKEERESSLEKIKNGSRYILSNPEVLQSEKLIQKLSECKIAHIAIDEAHCVSEWGDSFRPAYLTLGSIIKKLDVKIVTAFTATASPSVLTRISDILFDGNAHIVRSQSDRKNIHYEVIHTCAKFPTLIKAILHEKTPLIVFCATRKRTQEVAAFLEEFFFMRGRIDYIKFYHAGLEKKEKNEIEAWFYQKKEGVLCATCAYGMGVDKKDIHTVIHLDPAGTAEAYIQEAGRGGRDNSPAKAILLWSPNDSKKADQYKKGSRERVLKEFAEATTCRRQILLDALGGEKTICEGCDICEKTAHNYPAEAEIFFKFIKSHKRRYTKYEACSIFREMQNQKSLKTIGARLWENSNSIAVYTFLIESKKIKVRSVLWNHHLDIVKNPPPHQKHLFLPQ